MATVALKIAYIESVALCVCARTSVCVSAVCVCVIYYTYVQLLCTWSQASVDWVNFRLEPIMPA